MALSIEEVDLDALTSRFVKEWGAWVNTHEERHPSFDQTVFCQELIERGIISPHPSPMPGEYVVQATYAGLLFFTGRGDIPFTEAGLPLARKIAAHHAYQGGGRIRILKVIDEY